MNHYNYYKRVQCKCCAGGRFRKSGFRGRSKPWGLDHARQRRTSPGDEPHTSIAVAVVRRRQGYPAVHAVRVHDHQDGRKAPGTWPEQVGVKRQAQRPWVRSPLAPAQEIAA